MKRKRLITAAVIARALGVGRTSVYDAARRGELPHYRFGNTIRFDLDEVLRSCRRSRGDVGEVQMDEDLQERRQLARVLQVPGPGDGGIEEVPAFDWSQDDEE
jgi:excisionase family DNA binding protein